MLETEEKKPKNEEKEPEKSSKEKSLEEQLAAGVVTLLTGASGLSALKFLHDQKWFELLIAAALTGGFGFLRAFMQGFIGRDAKQMGETARKQLVQETERRRKPGFSQQYREAIEACCYKLDIEGEDAGGLALDEIYVALQVMSRRSQQAGLQKPQEIWKFLPAAGNQDKLTNRRIVVLAPPGYGKTTLRCCT